MKPNKRLVVCCDGTWQDLDCKYPTNVVKIAQAVKAVASDGVPQIVHYSEGIGTGPEKFDRWLGGAFGWGIDRRIQNAYRFLCFNYEAGDEIYLFGFSRGAYTARSLAGFIYKCGLLARPYIRKTKEAYALYRNRDLSPSKPEAEDFRMRYAVYPQGSAPGTQIPITLLGCWDTVGKLGVPKTIPLISGRVNEKYQFHDSKLNPKIQQALHAVAIDEHRSAFEVTHMLPNSVSNDALTHKKQVSEIWFTGTHGCVGGGTKENRGLSDITLKWMMDQITALGLGLEFVGNPNEHLTTYGRNGEQQQTYVIEEGIEVDPSIQFADNVKGIFALAGRIDRSLIDKEDRSTQLDQHFFKDRIHDSVKKRWQLATLDPQYRPKHIMVFKQWFDEIVKKES
ncbi:DUF2235 domain-containing protein [Phormidium sp. FACHB-592]|uniref:DUF2235 domain-containing protein n=1 Tax=Stenomitos frigidus AS-A4 TaxID=2933935 RepID=A0ABV0KLS6_9CYAN|nr:DUF2235 domain-containing protein [Phormidium sp. FACHB-592]MBD2072571.1 DUF2235 domain-containing protein [Phormidium sp. FACHB-592]